MPGPPPILWGLTEVNREEGGNDAPFEATRSTYERALSKTSIHPSEEVQLAMVGVFANSQEMSPTGYSLPTTPLIAFPHLRSLPSTAGAVFRKTDPGYIDRTATASRLHPVVVRHVAGGRYFRE